MMKFSSFTFIVTDDCNYQCTYCPVKKEKKIISLETIKKAMDFFYPLLVNGSFINFYGGEPLLYFDIVKEIILYVKQKNASTPRKQIDFSITTNGSLLDKEILTFLNRHRFSLMLSFDGYAHSISRKEGDFEKMITRVKEIQHYKKIDLKINSVFTPATVKLLAKSVQLMSDLGVDNMWFNASTIEEWDEKALKDFEAELRIAWDRLISIYKKTGNIPVSNFNTTAAAPKGLFTCGACKHHMAISPEDRLWGCYLFHDYFKGKENTQEYKKYCLGLLDDFIANHNTRYREILPNYANLRIDNFSTEKSYCFLCKEVANCRVCPIDAAYANGGCSKIGKVPAQVCSINRITRKIKKDFQRAVFTPHRSHS